MICDSVMTTIKKTIPLLEASGVAITEHFYRRLFDHHPELQHIFNMSNQQSGRQQLALFSAIAAYANNIDNLQALSAAVERIANKHSTLNIQQDHYDIVGHHLIETLRETAGSAFTDEVEHAWRIAYGVLAKIFVDRENTIYDRNESEPGGWKGPRLFRLIEKRIESAFVKSLVFEPSDKQPILAYKPGQYIGIRVTPPQHDFDEIRQYSLSSAPNGETYQISVKREIEGRPGLVSNFLHDGLRLGDEVELFAPAGNFFLNDKVAPVVLISAGVGLTPMTSMLDVLAARRHSASISFLHACKNSAQHSFRKHIHRYVNVDKHTWYADEKVNATGYYHGHMDLCAIENKLPLDNGEFYMCGPIPFMQYVKQQLLTLGVRTDRIHYEVFGPHDDL